MYNDLWAYGLVGYVKTGELVIALRLFPAYRFVTFSFQ
jgi:hypothetical protein